VGTLLLMEPEHAEKWALGVLPRIDGAAPKKGPVTVIPIHGMISRKESWFGISQDEIRSALKAAIEDAGTQAIVLHIDSPGGDAAGLADLAEDIHKMRGTKPIVAVTDGLMASAALWIGSAADRVVASQDAMVGSIGSVIVHHEVSKALAEDGIAVNIIRSGRNKFEGSSLEPLTDGARQRFQTRVDESAAMFRTGLARNRSMDMETAKAAFGHGEVFSAKDALARGLIDEIGSLQAVVARLEPSETFLSSQEAVDMTEQEKAELEGLREKMKAIQEKQRSEKFDTAKASALDPLRERVKAGTLAPAMLEAIAEAIERQRKDWQEGAGLAIPADLAAKLVATELPQGAKATDTKPEPKGDPKMRADEAFAQAVQRHMVEKRISYAQAWRDVAATQPELAEAYMKATAGPDFHNIVDRRAS